MNSFHAFSLAARRRKRSKATTRPGKGRWRAPDQVKRKFAADGINRRWYCDGTEIPTGKGSCTWTACWTWARWRWRWPSGAAPFPAWSSTPIREYTAAASRPRARLRIAQSVGLPGSVLDNVVIESWYSSGVRAAVAAQLRHQGGREDSGGGMDRGLQPCPRAFGTRDALPGELRAVAGGKGRRVHLVCDNYGTHKTPGYQDWLARHPRFHCATSPRRAHRD